MSESYTRVGPFMLGKTLGVGSTGKVKLGTHKDTGQTVAIKIVDKQMLASRPSLKRKVEREIAVLKVIDHPNVLRLFDVFETSTSLFLVLEHVQGGELFDYLVGKGRLSPEEALIFFQQIINGLDYCHTCLICHRDLKPENLLLDSHNQIKIADFGFASLMRDDDLLETSCGSPHYAAPEVVQGLKYDGTASDVWSCGVILYALLTGKLPFDDDNIPRLLSKVKSGKFQMPTHLAPEIQDLISRMLTVDPERRITLSEVKRHPWFRSNGAVGIDENPLESQLGELRFDPHDEKDPEIMETLGVLGWGTDDELLAALHSDEYNLEKVFYKLLERRKQEKEVMLADLYPDDGSDDSDSPHTPEGSPTEGSRYLQRRRSSSNFGTGPSAAIPTKIAQARRTSSLSSQSPPSNAMLGTSPGKTPSAAPRFDKKGIMINTAVGSPSSSSMPESPNPKKSWFSTMFEKKPSNLGQGQGGAAAANSTFGLHSMQPLDKINAELIRALDSLGIKHKIKGPYFIKAKYITPGGLTVKFKIESKDLMAQGHLVNFSLRQGDLGTFRSLYEYIQREVKNII